MKNERGITLAVLVITIIVMSILASTAIYMSIDENDGTINEVKNQTKIQQNMVQEEKKKMNTVLKKQEEEWGIG